MAFQTDITTNEAFAAEVLGTPGVLHVVEAYQDWCGASKPVASTLRKLFFDAGDAPLKFHKVSADRVAALEKYKGKCQPVFLFYLDGKVKEVVQGVHAPQLTQLVAQLMPAKGV